MAVDSLRDTFHTNRVNPNDLNDRLTAQSYRPDIIKAIKHIHDWGKWDRLKNLCDKPISQGRTPVYASTGRVCLKTRNVVNLIVSRDEVDWVSEEHAKTVKRFWIQDEDLLMTRSGSGSIGRVSIYFGDDEPLTNEELFRISVSNSYDSAFIGSFLTSWWGERLIEQGISGSTGQLKLVQDHVTDLPVILPDSKAQKYIGDKVRYAERLRDRSRKLEEEIQDEFEFLTKDLKPRKKAWRISSSKIEAYRLNSSHYDAVVLDMLEMAQDAIQLISLGTLFGSRGMSGGATPKGAIYPELGVFFVRVQNVKPLRLDLSDAVYLSASQNRELERSWCKAQEIILTITGYPGTAAIVLEDDLPLNINQHSVRFDIAEEWEPEYIVAALNSLFMKLQVNRLAIGATRDALDYTSVSGLLIPVLPVEVRQRITNSVKAANIYIRSSERFTTTAKLLVEALIEGKLSEANLKAAQEGLEQGDTTLDREILSRLTRKGIDCPNEPPLFPDLDALYAALASLDVTETTEESNSPKSQASNVYHLHRPSLDLASEADETAYQITAEVPE
jgi:type I restriction enzyme, S subunit